MGNSFIDFKEKGFWARDYIIEVMLLCLINEIENQNLDSTNWINEYKNTLALQSIPIIIGGMSMELDKFLINDELKGQLNSLIDLIIEKIDKTDNYITGNNLHKMRTRAMTILLDSEEIEFNNQKEFDETVNYSRWKESSGIEKAKDIFKHAFKLLKKLINGDMKTTVSSPIDYWNY